MKPDDLTDAKIATAIDVLEVLPRIDPSPHLEIQVPWCIDIKRVRDHLIRTLERRRAARPKVQVRKMPQHPGGRPEWCVIDTTKRGSHPMWAPPHFGWRGTLDVALLIATARTRA